MSRTLRATIIALVLAVPALGHGGIAESWYLARGRANLQIRNYAAAVEAYRKALAANPDGREASRGVGLALLGNGETDLAVAEFDRHLARHPDDAEIAFEQARLLQWARYAYRARDAARYLRMGLAVREDRARRRELARLLARERATVGEAIAEYDRLLAASPGDRALADERLKLLLWDPSRREEAIRALRARLAGRPADRYATRELARLLAEEPRTAGEAAALHRELLRDQPDDPALQVGLARALARAGRRAEAREAYARAVALSPSPEVRLERADLLAADPATREEARAEYEAVLRRAPRSRRAQLGLARVLGARQETAGDAIEAYGAVLAASPRDPEAHRGLARAYAWSGDADRALAHGVLAQRYGPRDDVAALEQTLRRGREPALGGTVWATVQPGGDFALRTVASLVRGAADPTPFTRSEVEAGAVTHRGPGGARADGLRVAGRAEWRASPAARVELAIGHDGARRGGQGLEWAVRLERRAGPHALSAALVRAPRQDSFRALAGEVVGDRVVGAASEHVIELSASRDDRPIRTTLRARAGAVTASGIRPVALAAVWGRADRTLLRAGALAIAAGARGDAIHHARDLSGLRGGGDPAAPRLFSPPLVATLSPRLALAVGSGPEPWLRVDAGPALQAVGGPSGGVRLGGDLEATLSRSIADRIRLDAGTRAERLASVHTRYAAGLSLRVIFP